MGISTSVIQSSHSWRARRSFIQIHIERDPIRLRLLDGPRESSILEINCRRAEVVGKQFVPNFGRWEAVVRYQGAAELQHKSAMPIHSTEIESSPALGRGKR